MIGSDSHPPLSGSKTGPSSAMPPSTQDATAASRRGVLGATPFVTGASDGLLRTWDLARDGPGSAHQRGVLGRPVISFRHEHQVPRPDDLRAARPGGAV